MTATAIEPLGRIGNGEFIQLAVVIELHGARGDAYDCTGARNACHGLGENADLGEGTLVSMTDDAGTLVAQLPLFLFSDPTDAGITLAAFPLVPGGDRFTLQIAERAPVPLSADELAQNGWIYRLDVQAT